MTWSQRLDRFRRRHLTRVADAAWILALFGGLVLFFWIIWNPPR